MFPGGINVFFPPETLIAFQSPAVPMQPWAVEAPFPWEWLGEGDPVRINGENVLLGPLVVRLDAAEICELRLSRAGSAIDVASLAERLKQLEGSVIDMAADPFAVRTREIVDAWLAGGNVAGLSDLIGLGRGLTPAGDDILVGILGGLRVLEHVIGARSVERIRVRLGSLIQQVAPRRTNLPGAQALCSAGEGRFCKPFLRLLEGLIRPESRPETLLNTARAVLSLGHTSGRDMLVGVIRALFWGLERSRSKAYAAVELGE